MRTGSQAGRKESRVARAAAEHAAGFTPPPPGTPAPPSTDAPPVQDAPSREGSAQGRAVDAERLFRALTSREVSRNKSFGSFTYDGYRRVHRRYRVVRAIQAEAERLADVPGSWCRVAARAGVLQVRLESPRLQYRREVALLPYEWEWLEEQTGIRCLLAAAMAQGPDARRLLP